MQAQAIGEITLHSGPANMWRSVEAVGGTLTLTSARLHFKPHAFNVQGGDWSVALGDIANVELGNSLWVIPNQIVVTQRNHKKTKLVVWGRDEWLMKIRHQLTR
ncbi:MAG TPA: hypothetical protein VGH87_04425 [Polyangiaceae bacterium]|jgi:hypothetical protein|nr:hypothetical protein [Polyangiaceae bacterium]